MEAHPLPSSRVALVEFDAIRDLLDGVAIKIDLELVHPFRMETGAGHGAHDRVANIDNKHRTDFAAKNVEIRGVQPDVLSSDRRVQMARHDLFLVGSPSSPRSARGSRKFGTQDGTRTLVGRGGSLKANRDFSKFARTPERNSITPRVQRKNRPRFGCGSMREGWTAPRDA